MPRPKGNQEGEANDGNIVASDRSGAGLTGGETKDSEKKNESNAKNEKKELNIT
ncbi:TPA: hypothetical protein H1005_02275, partial [archaeon]|nr:hypothetical protein [Candidatus Naiadarchaeales archaeon SRR2090153.bin1042]